MMFSSLLFYTVSVKCQDVGGVFLGYQQAWSIYQNDNLKADQKRQQLSALGYNGSALYKALGQKLE